MNKYKTISDYYKMEPVYVTIVFNENDSNCKLLIITQDPVTQNFTSWWSGDRHYGNLTHLKKYSKIERADDGSIVVYSKNGGQTLKLYRNL